MAAALLPAVLALLLAGNAAADPSYSVKLPDTDTSKPALFSAIKNATAGTSSASTSTSRCSRADICTQLGNGKADKLGLQKFWRAANVAGLVGPGSPLCNTNVRGMVVAPTNEAYDLFFKQACKSYYPSVPDCGFDKFMADIEGGNTLFGNISREIGLSLLTPVPATKSYITRRSTRLPGGSGWTDVPIPTLLPYRGQWTNLAFYRASRTEWHVRGGAVMIPCVDPVNDVTCNKGIVTWDVLRSCGQVLHKTSRIPLP